MKKTLQVITTFSLIMAFSATIIYYKLSLQKAGQDCRTKSRELSRKISILENQISEKEQGEINTENWKIYTDKKIGIKFKYPENFLAKEESSLERISIKSTEEGVEVPYLQIQFISNTIDYLIEDSISRIAKPDRYNDVIEKDIVVNGLDGKMIGNSGQKDTESVNYREIFVKISEDRVMFVKTISIDDLTLAIFLKNIEFDR